MTYETIPREPDDEPRYVIVQRAADAHGVPIEELEEVLACIFYLGAVDALADGRFRLYDNADRGGRSAIVSAPLAQAVITVRWMPGGSPRRCVGRAP